MNGYPYPSRPYPGNGSVMDGVGGDGMNGFNMGEGQSLDQIVSQNDKAENIRRRSMPVYAPARTQQMQMSSPDNRRLSMMNFGDAGGVDDFQFDMQTAGMEGMMRNNPTFPHTTTDMQNDRLPATDLAINTQFHGQTSPFPGIAAPGSAYASPLHNAPLDMDMSPYPNGMSMSMDMDESLNIMPPDMNMFPTNQFSTSMMDSPVTQEFIGPMPAPGQDAGQSSMQSQDRFKHPSLSNTPETRSGASGMPSRTSSQDQSSMRSQSRPQSEQHSSSKSSNLPTQMSLASLQNQQPIALEPGQDLPKEKMNQLSNFKLPWSPPAEGFPSTMHQNPHMKTQFKNAYSSTGFDMLGILVRPCKLCRRTAG